MVLLDFRLLELGGYFGVRGRNLCLELYRELGVELVLEFGV